MKKAAKAIAQLDECQSDVLDIKRELAALLSAIDCAESCETLRDFRANIDEAESLAASIRNQIEDICKKAAQ